MSIQNECTLLWRQDDMWPKSAMGGRLRAGKLILLRNAQSLMYPFVITLHYF